MDTEISVESIVFRVAKINSDSPDAVQSKFISICKGQEILFKI